MIISSCTHNPKNWTVAALLCLLLLLSGCWGRGAKQSPAADADAVETTIAETSKKNLNSRLSEEPTPAALPSNNTSSDRPVAPVTGPQIVRPQSATQGANRSASDGQFPSRLVLPSLDLDTAVVELGWHQSTTVDGDIFSEWDVANNAAGWHKNSALPGEGGNVVLSGHNNVAGAVFRELDQLKRGDKMTLWMDGQPHDYLIDQVVIVPEKYASQEQREENATWIQSFDEERVTMVSCWPRDDNSHRIIVVAHPAENATAQQ